MVVAVLVLFKSRTGPGRSRLVTRWILVLLGAAIIFLAAPAASWAAVIVFPSPGDPVAPPRSQIAIRGIPYNQLTAATITVTGSKSGAHTGRLAPDSDGQGGSFLPNTSFTPGETVTVKTSLNVLGGTAGTFHFVAANPAGVIPPGRRVAAKRVKGDVWQFHSTSLEPAAVRITNTSGQAAPGDIFLAPQKGPVEWGPEILDSQGNPVWSLPVPGNQEATNFGVQTYRGKPVLTWWQGNENAGSGRGTDMVYNSSYQRIAAVKAANGLSADPHEFQITPASTALITAFYPVFWNASSVHGAQRQNVVEGVVQEIDIKTGLVLFEWDSLAHVPLTDTYAASPKTSRTPFDYLHVNSIDLDHDGNLVISARNTSAVYKVSSQTGQTIWTLGGKHSSFAMGPGTSFTDQHDARVVSDHDWYVTIFDDGGGPPVAHRSRGLKLFLDVTRMRTHVVTQYEMSPPQQSYVEGNYQQLPDTHVFLGWGSAQYFSEFTTTGQQIMYGRFVASEGSYRIFRYPWSGTPKQPPAIAASKRGSHAVVYASWNGTTAVASWRVLGGRNSNSLRTVGTATKRGFETEITTSAKNYVAVQAVDAKGHALAKSQVVRPS
jgi:Arylsulfotransferase (ASST)